MNFVVATGRLATDPELKTTPNGTDVVQFCMAVDREYVKDRERETDFFNVVAWRATATFIEKYFKKGSPIAIRGKLRTRKYEDKSGNKRTAVEIVAYDVEFNSFKDSSTQSKQEKPAAPESSKPAAEAPGNRPMFGYSDDEDIPF